MSNKNQSSLMSFFTKTAKNEDKNKQNESLRLESEKRRKSDLMAGKIDDASDEDGAEVKNPKRQRLQILDSDEEDNGLIEIYSDHNGNSEETKLGANQFSTPTSTKSKKRKLQDASLSKSSKKSPEMMTPKSIKNERTNLPKSKCQKDTSDPSKSDLTSTPKLNKTVENWSFTQSPHSSSAIVGMSEQSRSFLSSFCADDVCDTSRLDIDNNDFVSFKHMHFDFLHPDKIRDENKLKPSDPNYDRRTLFVPESFIKSQSPGLKQWWEIKRKHFDTLLLFKVGKFYELYHMDAVIAVKELNLSLMKGDHAHCGFPEIAYSRFADQLVERGHKVARVEQTETPDMMEERLKVSTPRTGPKEKVVRREVCRITTLATKTYSFLDGDTDSAQGKHLYAICEESLSDLKSIIGICFVDTAVGKIYLSQFEDEAQFSKLHTLLAQYPPGQILYPRTKLSSRLDTLLKSHYSYVLKESLAPKSQFWTATTTLKTLSSSKYFDDGKNKACSLFSVPILKDLLNENDPLGLTPGNDYKLCLSSLGGIIWYLQECLIDIDVLSLKNFVLYVPPEKSIVKNDKNLQVYELKCQTMVLDGITLKNLEIVPSNDNSNAEGTLFQLLDTCSTNFGKRLLRHWLCNPICNVATIKLRQLAVEDLLEQSNFVTESTKLMKQMPDLERLLQKIHTLGSKRRRDDHPDGRAILYNMDVYNKRKVNDLLTALDGFKKVVRVIDNFQSCKLSVKSALLKRCLCFEENEESEDGKFPKLNEILEYFDQSFDHDQAKKDGIIVPSSKGIDEHYDEALVGIKSAENELHNYLLKQRSRFNCGTISYITSGRNRYQLEVPDAVVSKLTEEFEFESQRKGFKRYSTKDLAKLREKLAKFETEKDIALKDVMRRIFASFSNHIEIWRRAINCLATVDVLMAFVRYVESAKHNGLYCCPEVVEPSVDIKPFIRIQDGIHPCQSKINTSVGSFVSNDTNICCHQNNNSNACILLITGPNMGGKSTLMRQVSLIVVMAQIGCYVPAKSCTLTPVDRIFTRLGASDRIAAGQSTFFVELSETSDILKHATSHSLVVLDELGRGTSTHDGRAIASAVLTELACKIKCRTMFSTHYHSLVDEFRDNPNILTGHMACVVENENSDDPTEETVTFLYKLSTGSCPKSFGFHAAKLAGLPLQVIRRGWEASKKMETGFFSLDKLRSVAMGNVDLLSNEMLIEKLVEAMKM